MLKKECTRRKKIIWIRSTIIDLFLDKAAEMEMLKHLAKRGNDVYLFAGQSKNQSQVFDSLRKFPNIHFILIPLRYVPVISTLLLGFIFIIFSPFVILIERPSFIILEPGPSIVCFIWKPLLYPLKCRAILDIRSTPVFLKSRAACLHTFLFNISVLIAKRIFDGMTILTPLMKKEICNKFHINPKFIGVWTMGVSTTLFNPENYDGAKMRNKLGLNNKFIVFHHGVFGFRRGIIESIKSIEILGNKYNDLVLFLLGKGPALPTLKELVQKSRLQDKVIINDAVDYFDVPQYIAMCDVGIVALPDLAIWRHQCPQKLLEYLAMKKVVIVTEIPANKEVVGRSKCGIYVSSADPKEIAKAIAYAYDNRDKLKEWGSSGRIIVNERYSWERVAEDFENYILKC